MSEALADALLGLPLAEALARCRADHPDPLVTEAAPWRPRVPVAPDAVRRVARVTFEGDRLALVVVPSLSLDLSPTAEG